MLSAILGMAACSLDPAPSQQEAQPVIVANPIPREPIAPPPPPVPAPAITTNYLIPHANIELPAPPQIALDHSGREAMFIALDEPGLDDLLPDPVTIWGTTYYTPHYEPLEDGIALIGLDDQPISPPLSRKQWCNIALQGSASIASPDGEQHAYVFIDSKGPEQTDCDDYLGNLPDNIKRATRRARFRRIRDAYGCGINNWPLAPFRTIAVDSSFIGYGETLYIPELRGRQFHIGETEFTHDGYVFAADRGGAVKGNHIDFFSGNSRETPFTDLFAAHDGAMLEAYRVAPDALPALHLSARHDADCTD